MQLTHKRDDNWSRLLIRVGKQRDRVAFENLFNHFSPLIKGFCLSRPNLIVSSEAAEELVQEVMFKVWEKAPYFESHRASASTWIFTVMRNCRIDLSRRDSPRACIVVDDIWDDTTESQPFVFLQPSRDQESVNRSLQKLPVEQFHVIKKMYMEAKSSKEISTDLGLPLDAVNSRVQLALKKLQTDVRR
jgi:RNA polymerase sigma factor (sigma-70 family)